jgi:hypothetical protein
MAKWGITNKQVHAYLSVKSLKDWVAGGKSLDQAEEFIKQKLIAEGKAPPAEENTPTSNDGDEGLEEFERQAKQPKAQTAAPQTARPATVIKPRSDWDKITKAQVTDYPTLEIIFGRLTSLAPKRMYQELGVAGRTDMSISPWAAFVNLKEIFAPADAPP